MDRLTLTKEQREAEGVGYAKYFAPELCKEIDEKLTAYEDTGLTPDEIVTLNDFSTSQCAKLLEKNTALQAENAELRARLEKSAELPCEYGVTVYYVHEPDGEIKMSHVIGFYYNGFYLSLDIEGIGKRHEKLLGNTIFLTYKEVTDFKYTRKKAEAALAEHERRAKK